MVNIFLLRELIKKKQLEFPFTKFLANIFFILYKMERQNLRHAQEKLSTSAFSLET